MKHIIFFIKKDFEKLVFDVIFKFIIETNLKVSTYFSIFRAFDANPSQGVRSVF